MPCFTQNRALKIDSFYRHPLWRNIKYGTQTKTDGLIYVQGSMQIVPARPACCISWLIFAHYYFPNKNKW